MLICPSWPLFSLFSSYQESFLKQLILNKICQWLDSNQGPLVLEAAALSTVPQPPPKDLFCLCADVIGGCLKTNGNIRTYLNILFSLAVIIYVNMIYTFALISNIFSASGKKIRPKYGKVWSRGWLVSRFGIFSNSKFVLISISVKLGIPRNIHNPILETENSHLLCKGKYDCMTMAVLDSGLCNHHWGVWQLSKG